MKVYKSEPNEYGWYWVVHKRSDGVITIFQKSLDHKEREYKNIPREFSIWEEGLDILLEALLDENPPANSEDKTEVQHA